MALPVTPNDVLDGQHLDALSRAIGNVLKTKLALTTLAQIIDGLPTLDTVWDQYSSKYHRNHPINRHEQVCPGSLEKANDFIRSFDIGQMNFRSEVRGTQLCDASNLNLSVVTPPISCGPSII